MIISLSPKNKILFFDGSLPKPDESDVVHFNPWKRNNNIIISWLLNSVSKEIAASIIYLDNAVDIWADLRDRFQQINDPKIFQLRHDIVNLKQDSASVSLYFTKLKILWEELNNYRPVCTCGKCCCGGYKNILQHFQNDYAMTFLMGLNDSFSHIRGQILLMDPMSPINKVFSLIL